MFSPIRTAQSINQSIDNPLQIVPVSGNLFKRPTFLPLLILVSWQLTAQAGSCDAPPDSNNKGGVYIEERAAVCLQDPGWLDVGVGVAVVEHAGSQKQNGIGNMVTLRAYPFGRWYAPLKTSSPEKITLIAAKAALANTKQTEASGAPLDNTKQQDASNTAHDLALEMQNALNEFGNSYALYENDGWANFYKRFSVFYGRSVGGFDVTVVQGDISAFGISFDVAPQFALSLGQAYFNQIPLPGQASANTSGLMFSMQINLNAFKMMRSLTD